MQGVIANSNPYTYIYIYIYIYIYPRIHTRTHIRDAAHRSFRRGHCAHAAAKRRTTSAQSNGNGRQTHTQTHTRTPLIPIHMHIPMGDTIQFNHKRALLNSTSFYRQFTKTKIQDNFPRCMNLNALADRDLA